MADIIEPLGPVRVLAKPKRCPPLRTFSCGRYGNRWERTVNEWAKDLYRGDEKVAQTVVIMEDANSKLVGIGSFRPEPLPVRAGKFADKVFGQAQCIHMLATDRLFRGQRLRDGSRPGDVLMRGVLEQIEIAADGRMPYVWALVSPENARSNALFDRHGFGELPYAGDGEMILVRPPYKRAPVRLPFALGRSRRAAPAP